ncbi:MAG: TonB family protein, partial [candidate division Zixibacteria bacterium]|nr:TonB family protein [candidate division Zixibacteria bacterium]
LPQFTHYQKARYPDSALSARIHGTTKLVALIDTSGALLEANVLRSSGDGSLDSSAKAAVAGHRFKPGLIGTRKVKAWMTWLVKFEPGSKDVVTPAEEKAAAQGLVMPETERVVTPKMPAAALKNGHTGTVWLQVDVGEDGRVRDARMERSSGFAELDSTAIAVARDDTFKPAMYKGKPRAFTLRYRVIFAMKKE